MTFEGWQKSQDYRGNAAESWEAATLAERERCAKICDDILSSGRTEYETARTAGRIREQIKGETK